MTRIIFVFFLFLLIPGSFVSAFGMVNDLSTNKSFYYDGDQLIVSGDVSYDPSIPFVTVQIFTPGKSNFADFDTVPANADGSFSAAFNVGGPTWSSYGIYPIKITYGGNKEISIEYRESLEIPSSETSTPQTSTPQTSTPQTSTPQTSTPQTSTPQTSIPENVSEPLPLEPVSTFSMLKLQVPNFPALDKSPQYYIDRYNGESSYKSWFDSQFPNYSINDVVGYKSTQVPNFPALDKSPQYYIDRYNGESSYKSWFDSQFPNSSIYNVLGYADPISVPDWIRNNAEWWAIGEIDDSTFVSGIEFMLENDIIMVSSVSSGNSSDEEIPAWIRNNAHWWSQDLISENEFISSLEYLIREGIITIN